MIVLPCDFVYLVVVVSLHCVISTLVTLGLILLLRIPDKLAPILTFLPFGREKKLIIQSVLIPILVEASYFPFNLEDRADILLAPSEILQPSLKRSAQFDLLFLVLKNDWNSPNRKALRRR